ncbi:MAG TPA: hypothetical protein VK840_04500 [Candidatus Dormibacteraeota bacterium]|jgi:hypothetical protein|nr:hypothetical protein [Candidatus Dormibacteraeota bacterium]
MMVTMTRLKPTKEKGRTTPKAVPNEHNPLVTKNNAIQVVLYLSPHPEPLKHFSNTIKIKPGTKINGSNARPKNRLLRFWLNGLSLVCIGRSLGA